MPSRPVAVAAILLLSLGSPGLSAAKSLGDPEIGLALGDLMYEIELYAPDPKLANTASDLKESALFPVDPDTLVLQFPTTDIKRRGDTWRLVLTEYGMWGYAPIKRGNDRRILAQADLNTMLQDYRSSRRAWAAIKNNIPVAGGAIALTRGEVYPLETTSQASVVIDRDLPITHSKFLEIEKLNKLPAGVERSGNRYLVNLVGDYSASLTLVSLDKVQDIYDQPSEGGRLVPADVRRAKMALASSPKFFVTRTGTRLECNEVQTYKTDQNSKNAWSAKIGLDLGKFIESLSTVAGSFGLSGGLEVGFSNEIQETITQTVTFAALSFDYDIHLLEQAGQWQQFLIGNSRNCKQSPTAADQLVDDGDRFYRVAVPGIAGFLIAEDLFHKIQSDLPNIQWNTTTGKLTLSCSRRDYAPMIEFMHETLNLEQSVSRYLLRRISVTKPTGFFDC